jgi:hypothetical protein
MAFALKFGSLTLDGIRSWDVDNPYRATRHHFPRRQGTIAPRVPAKDAKTIICEGDLWKDNRAQVKEYFRLLGKIGDAGRERLVLEDDNNFMNAVLESVHQRLDASTAPDVHMPYTLRFVADDPFIYSADQQEETETVGAANSLNFSLTNNGGARTPAVFQITRTDPANEQANVKIEQTTTGLYLQWAGTLPTDSSVIFDCVNRRVTALGSNGLGNFTGQIRLELEVGLNNFAYTGPGNVTIVVAWLERWGLT